MRQTLIAIVVGLSFAFAAATPASAHTPESQIVRYADLNLDARAGQDALLNRIDRAARRACLDRSGPMPLSQRFAIRACKRSAMQEAVIEFQHAGVTQRYIERGGELPTVIVANR